MNEIEEKLNTVLGLITNYQNPWDVINSFDEMTLSYNDIAKYIIPFLNTVEKESLRLSRENENDLIFDNGEVLKYFTEKYFNCIKENGYYKSEKISFYKDWLCLNCEKLFDVPESQKYLMIEDLTCIHCGSKNYIHNSKIQKAKIDGKTTAEIFEMIGKRKSEIPQRSSGEIHFQFSATN